MLSPTLHQLPVFYDRYDHARDDGLLFGGGEGMVTGHPHSNPVAVDQDIFDLNAAFAEGAVGCLLEEFFPGAELSIHGIAEIGMQDLFEKVQVSGLPGLQVFADGSLYHLMCHSIPPLCARQLVDTV
jgi:hypothetical protein